MDATVVHVKSKRTWSTNQHVPLLFNTFASKVSAYHFRIVAVEEYRPRGRGREGVAAGEHQNEPGDGEMAQDRIFN